jgi:8-oxo-dGTP pyrophosphatase MutT (NUDIX family)
VTGLVRAAGGVPFRLAPDLLLAVVHRPRYDDWSFPKGKCDPGEADEEAALRELHEETGLRGHLGRELPSVRYRDRQGRPKLVRYWLVGVDDGPFVPNDEVDELRWLAPGAARALLSYGHDRRLVDTVAALRLGEDGTP